jgi:hypothetical protein
VFCYLKLRIRGQTFAQSYLVDQSEYQRSMDVASPQLYKPMQAPPPLAQAFPSGAPLDRQREEQTRLQHEQQQQILLQQQQQQQQRQYAPPPSMAQFQAQVKTQTQTRKIKHFSSVLFLENWSASSAARLRRASCASGQRASAD